MLRKDRIYEYILKESEKPGFNGISAKNISEALDIWRNDVSVELNRLVDEGKLVKAGKKNILYSIKKDAPEKSARMNVKEPEKSHTEDLGKQSAAFSNLVGFNGSLKQHIEIAKAAVSYPPNGLNMLIMGPTGSGKTYFTYSIWEYAKECGAFGKKGGDIPFVHFNCAEYADNPQLLLSHLFGHKKGAFTDALYDSTGLVEEANGGILFLDEIHSLPSTGQEILFTLLDTGFYRRLGDTQTRESHFMLIGATNMSIEDSLLEAFVRRLPIVIQIPSLAERPGNELMDFISCFFQQESDRMKTDVCVQKNALNRLMEYAADTNVGLLKNVIQISCAKARLRELSGKDNPSQTITVTNMDLLLTKKENESEESEDATAKRRQWYSQDLYIRTGEKWCPAENGSFTFDNIFDYVDQLLDNGYSLNLDEEDITSMVLLRLDEYYNDQRMKFEQLNNDSELIDSTLPAGLLEISWSLLDMASEQLDRIYTSQTAVLLAVQLDQYMNQVKISNMSSPIYLSKKVLNDTPELTFLFQNRNWLEKQLGCHVSRDELILLSPLLKQNTDTRKASSVYITLLSRNYNTAVTMGRFVINLYRLNNIYMIENDIGDDFSSLMDLLCNELKKHHGENGNIIITDIKMLASVENDIIKKSGVNCRVIPILEQNLLMAACKSSQTLGVNLEQVYTYTMRAYANGVANIMENGKVKEISDVFSDGKAVKEITVIVACNQGEETKNLLLQRLAYIPNLKIITADSLNEMRNLSEKYHDSLKLIVGTEDPGIPDVPFVLAEDLLSSQGMRDVYAMLDDSFQYHGAPLKNN